MAEHATSAQRRPEVQVTVGAAASENGDVVHTRGTGGGVVSEMGSDDSSAVADP